ncbi:MAG: S9 family peptidase, partial [Gammaproteobacteria bacterium]|nr:S9 family peptidase [Gammaproteobacteria bacterium]
MNKYNKSFLAGVILLLGCSEPQVPTTAMPSTPRDSSVKTYTAEQFYLTTSYRMSSAAGFGFSADSSRVLVSSDATGVFNAYALNVAGGVPEPLTASTVDSTFAVTYFPRDDRVLLTADQGGNELIPLYVRELDGTTTDLTP